MTARHSATVGTNGLSIYRKKRDFAQTSEPTGTSRRGTGRTPAVAAQRSYVVHKHAASHLHYDFRLELDGVLLSWAVPKRPSLDPKVKRLAVQVEPHPLEYGTFEGTIPKGQYGGGTVMVWDHGTWSPEGNPEQGLKKGRLSFTLSGEKLRGKWHLVRTASESEKPSWLLFKAKDEYADALPSKTEESEDRSSQSGRTFAEIAEDKAVLHQPKPKVHRRTARGNSARADGKVRSGDSKGPKEALPTFLEPELATLVESAPEGDDFIHEIKFDGYRLMVRREGDKVTLLSRNGLDWTERIPALARAAAGLPGEAFLLDGELVALNERGVSDFQALQNSLKVKSDSELCYFVFDLLHLNGTNIRGFSLLQRKELLKALLAKRTSKNAPLIRLSDHVVGGGPAFFLKACEEKLEGIVSKRARSPYRSGRGRDWLKVKCLMRQEFVVVGFTEPHGGRSHLGALLLGVWRGAELVYVGRVGTGFNERKLLELYSRLSHLITEKSAVKHQLPRAQVREVTWVQPKLVAEVGFAGFTADGLLRHPTFVGLREDKDAEEVHLEVAAKKLPNPAAGLGTYPPKRRAEAAASSNTQGYVISHPDKLLYHDAKITKRDLLDYYSLVGKRMLPHLARRPLTLVRCPDGQGRPCFFQKHFAQGAPPGIHSISGSDGNEPYPFVESEEGLFGLVQLGALEIHTWGSRVDNLEHPDILVFDLDPDPELPFQAVIEAAKELRAVFASANLESFVKTTGGKGLHVCLPVAPSLDWKEAKAFSREVAHALVAQSPKRYVATQSKAKRTGKVFIDYLRNGRGATFIAPYSTRARPNAPVAMPIEWEELTPKLRADQFTLRNARERLNEADPFARLVDCKQQLPEVKRGSRV